MSYCISMIFGYLLGSISTGVLLSRFFAHRDIRELGSGNPGATNMLRTMGKRYGLVTFLGDMLKGALAAWIGKELCGNEFGALLAGISAVIGHNFPLYFQFKGGKGISTSFAALLVVYPMATLLAFLTFLIVVFLTQYVSAGSIAAAISLPIYTWLFATHDPCILALITSFSILAIVRHKANIVRLLHHEENKLHFSHRKI